MEMMMASTLTALTHKTKTIKKTTEKNPKGTENIVWRRHIQLTWNIKLSFRKMNLLASWIAAGGIVRLLDFIFSLSVVRCCNNSFCFRRIVVTRTRLCVTYGISSLAFPIRSFRTHWSVLVYGRYQILSASLALRTLAKSRMRPNKRNSRNAEINHSIDEGREMWRRLTMKMVSRIDV